MTYAPHLRWAPQTTLLILGHGRHGKDTVAEIMRDDFGLQYESSSWAAAESVCRPYLEKKGLSYPTLEACYADRHNYRELWHQAIAEYNREDPAKLARDIIRKGPVYVGMRSHREYRASKHLFGLTIWVDAFGRQPPESKESFNIDRSVADVIIDNSEIDPTNEILRERVRRLMVALGYRKR